MKNWTKFLVTTGVCGLLLGSIIQFPTISQSNISECQQGAKTFSEQCAEDIAVKVLKDYLWGSGVLIKKETVGEEYLYTVVTNAHVLLQTNLLYRIQTSDGQIHQANLLQKLDNPDIAFLQFSSVENYPIADLNPAFSLASLPQGDKVFAIGYPVDESQGFVVKEGKISILLPQAMSGGYQIGFSASIVSGMSGGALLNSKGEVIGIIGKSSNPPSGYPQAYQFDNKFPPLLFPQSLMEESSWAIPIEIVVAQNHSLLSSSLSWGNNISPEPEKTQDNSLNNNKVIVRIESKSNQDLEKNLNTYHLFINIPDKNDPQNQEQNVIDTKIETSQVISQNHQIVDLNGDKKDEIIVTFSIREECKNTISFIYEYSLEQRKYIEVQSLKYKVEIPIEDLQEDYFSLGDFDNDGTLEIKIINNELSCILSSNQNNINENSKAKDEPEFQTLILQIFKYENGKINDVTPHHNYQTIQVDFAEKMRQLYINNINIDKDKTDKLKSILASYLITNFFIDDLSNGWKNVRNWYGEEDKNEYFEQLCLLTQNMKLKYPQIPYNINNCQDK